MYNRKTKPAGMKMIFLFALWLFASAATAQDSTKPAAKKDTLKAADNNFDVIYTKVEIESVYPGGQQAWFRFMANTLRYPDEAVNKEIQGTVIVQFIVDTTGNVSNIEAISGPLTGGLREEAVRVIKKSGNWIPAVQNGRKVKSYKKQPLVFSLSFG
jgi:periplasmic protein TonB